MFEQVVISLRLIDMRIDSINKTLDCVVWALHVGWEGH